MNSTENPNKKIKWLVITTAIVSSIIFSLLVMSCNRELTPTDAANGKAKCHKKY